MEGQVEVLRSSKTELESISKAADERENEAKERLEGKYNRNFAYTVNK